MQKMRISISKIKSPMLKRSTIFNFLSISQLIRNVLQSNFLKLVSNMHIYLYKNSKIQFFRGKKRSFFKIFFTNFFKIWKSIYYNCRKLPQISFIGVHNKHQNDRKIGSDCLYSLIQKKVDEKLVNPTSVDWSRASGFSVRLVFSAIVWLVWIFISEPTTSQ